MNQQKACPLCLKSYNIKKNRSRMRVCSRGHLCCLSCLERMIFQKQKKCYTCKADLNPSEHKTDNFVSAFTHHILTNSIETTAEGPSTAKEQKDQTPKMEILKKYYFVVILVFAVVGVIALAIQISEIQTCEYFKYKQCPYTDGKLCCQDGVKCPLTFGQTSVCKDSDDFEIETKRMNIFWFAIGVMLAGSLTISIIVLIIIKAYRAHKYQKLNIK